MTAWCLALAGMNTNERRILAIELLNSIRYRLAWMLVVTVAMAVAVLIGGIVLLVTWVA